jgi:uncharacterized protein DUF3226
MYQRGMPIIMPKLLLGEGIEEVYFFSALLDHLGVTDVQVDQYDGKSRIAAGLRAIKGRSGFINQVVSLGVTRDADYADDPADDAAAAQRAFQSVCGALAYANLPVPIAPMVKAADKPEISVFILPDNRLPGMLEDLCIASTSAPDINCITEYFDCVELKTGRVQVRRNVAKSWAHAWLATQSEPDKQLGQAALAGYWDWNNPAFDLIKQFVLQL